MPWKFARAYSLLRSNSFALSRFSAVLILLAPLVVVSKGVDSENQSITITIGTEPPSLDSTIHLFRLFVNWKRERVGACSTRALPFPVDRQG